MVVLSSALSVEPAEKAADIPEQLRLLSFKCCYEEAWDESSDALSLDNSRDSSIVRIFLKTFSMKSLLEKRMGNL